MKNSNSRTKSQKPFAKKSFGQNFLVDEKYIEEIIRVLDPQSGETIIEIGAGRGALTRGLIKSDARVLAIEFDQDLIPLLEQEFGGEKNFKVIQADALKIDFRQTLTEFQIEDTRTKIVGNLPYNISTAILQRLIEQRKCFSELILMLQREVVDRLTAPPGTSERSYLSVLVEAYAEPEKLFDVPPKSFRPIPQVWSSVVRLDIKETQLITDSVENENLFWQLISISFAQKRKTILNNLKNSPVTWIEKLTDRKSLTEILQKTHIEPNRRAETLALAEWILLFDSIKVSENNS